MVTMTPVLAAQRTDAELIADSVAEPAAFAAVFDRHYAAIHGFLAARVGASLADELASETFLRALRGARRYDRAYPDARPWLYAIATNLVAGHRRAEARRLRAYARVGPPDEIHRDPSGFPPELAGALAELPAADRDALLLVAWAELSYEEAARAAGVPVGTVRSRIHRARRRLRAALGESIDTEQTA
ncbi:MAG: polymerase ECF-subfamily sigma factor [Solirubrobacteraceae bacterium]|nr:polymerase ECF-subfamily sigma factor [Solirubrobacteraceae bacterium]